MANTSAEQIYNTQNRALHRAFTAAGMPYNSNRKFWQPTLCRIAGRKVTGLSVMTLGERYRLIQDFRQKGISLFSPSVSKALWDWKKGDTDVTASTGQRPLQVPEDKQAMVKKIAALLAENKLPWSYADAIAQKRFNVRVVEWLRTEDLQKVMQMLIKYNRRHGGSEG